jgi:hypothetical protein
MAYVGDSKAAIDTQIEGKEGSYGLYGAVAFLLWRSVYITKQVREGKGEAGVGRGGVHWSV